ncbi:neurotrophin 1 isoform X1 [Bombus affinis]|uniref:neurotrophin 1 isoform X1 n=1 Tax=Bombus affinis TaxID=309941 RepID=UPI0021B7A121|nr:neurotrophin 1 isoform X1 [Bombus affinis]
MMMTRGLFFITVAVVLLSSINVSVEKDLKDDVDLNDRKENNETTVTSIKINDVEFKNRTDKLRESQLEEVRALLNNGSRQNASRELMLPKSADIAKIISDDPTGDEEGLEELPEPQELRIIRPNLRKRPGYRPPLRRPTSLNRRNVYADLSRTSLIRPPRRPTEVKRDPTEKDCTFFTKTVCLEVADYPHEAITRSLRSNKEMVAALLTDYKSQDFDESAESLPIALPLENKYENRYESNEIRRRSDASSSFENVEEGFTCPSVIKYARPQLARAASGIWKYIINTGEHTQTLRMEKCSNLQSSCSFISENYRSSCMQVYNYHRLLTWDNKLGLHMDIFKVPSCCSCHVHGYADIFPPHQKDPSLRIKESFPGSDFATSDQKDDFEESPKLNYLNKFPFDSSLGSSNKKPTVETTPSRPPFILPVRTRSKKPSSTSSRPFDKLPQQHAPNTRAPGYTGPLLKGSRPSRPNRPPYRRESTSHVEEQTETVNSTILNRYSQPYDLQMDATSRLQNGGFDDEYQEPQRRINYNYHPIIDFFRPEAMMLQSSEDSSTSDQNDSNSWKPLIAS